MTTIPVDFSDRQAAARRIVELSDTDYEQVRQVLVRLELKHAMDEVASAMDDVRDQGRMGDVAESIRAFRERHPYQ